MRLLKVGLYFLFMTQTIYAWPLFTVPSNQDIQQTKQFTLCEQNTEQFRFATNAIIPVRFVGDMHPKGWQWTSRSQSPCFWKNQSLPIKGIEITKTRNPDGEVINSIINAFLVAPDGRAFSLNLTTPRESWDCHLEKQAPNYIICANDI